MSVKLFLAGWIWVTLLEYLIHKHLLHGHARKKGSPFRFHWTHHSIAKKLNGLDDDYLEPILVQLKKSMEIRSVGFTALLHLPIALLSKAFFLGNLMGGVAYCTLHAMSHYNPEWGWRFLPWHMKHHLVNPHKNWGVTNPFWDWLFGTLV